MSGRRPLPSASPCPWKSVRSVCAVRRAGEHAVPAGVPRPHTHGRCLILQIRRTGVRGNRRPKAGVGPGPTGIPRRAGSRLGRGPSETIRPAPFRTRSRRFRRCPTSAGRSSGPGSRRTGRARCSRSGRRRGLASPPRRAGLGLPGRGRCSAMVSNHGGNEQIFVRSRTHS